MISDIKAIIYIYINSAMVALKLVIHVVLVHERQML